MKHPNSTSYSLGIVSDHAGYSLKLSIINNMKDILFKDYGCFSEESVDYPDFMPLLCKGILNGAVSKGIAICGTGIGASIVCNRFPNIRAALCKTPKDAEMSRRHNDANILVLSGHNTEYWKVQELIDIFLNTRFDAGRHIKRIYKIEAVCKDE